MVTGGYITVWLYGGPGVSGETKFQERLGRNERDTDFMFH